MNPLLLKYLPYLLAAIAFAAVGAAIAHAIDQGPYHRLQDEYAAYKLTVVQAEKDAQKTAREALQAQIAQANTTDQHNAQVIADLTAQADHSAADARIARGLLELARKARPSSGSAVPETADQRGTVVAAQDPGDRQTADLLAGAVGECRDAINTLRALQAEVIPQL